MTAAEAVVALLADGVTVGASERPRLDPEDAAHLTAQLRRALCGAAVATEYAAQLYAEAWERRCDLALGYRSWDAYLTDCLGDLSALRLPIDVRRRMVATMVAVGMPRRKVARALGVSDGTVRGDLAALGPAAPTPLEPADPEDDAAREPAGPAPTKVALCLAALARAGARGLTAPELGRRVAAVPDPGAVLSEAHRRGTAARLAVAEPDGTRGGHAVYVAPTPAAVAGRAVEGPGRRSRSRTPGAAS